MDISPDGAYCIDRTTSLRDTQDALRAVFEGVETGILVIDPTNHRIVDASPVALALIGSSREETVGAAPEWSFESSRTGLPIDLAVAVFRRLQLVEGQ